MKNYTLAEAAAELRVSLRSMSSIVARHPHYYAVGNRKLFTEEDMQKIIAGLREEATTRARHRGHPVPNGGVSTSAQMATEKALKLLRAGSTSKKKR